MSLTPEPYREEALSILKDTGAFLRISRGEGLFVTDAPRREKARDAVIQLNEKYRTHTENGLMYLTPLYFTDDEEMEKAYTGILKADAQLKEKLIRTGLSVAMRKKDMKKIRVYEDLLEGVKRL